MQHNRWEYRRTIFTQKEEEKPETETETGSCEGRNAGLLGKSVYIGASPCRQPRSWVASESDFLGSRVSVEMSLADSGALAPPGVFCPISLSCLITSAPGCARQDCSVG